MNGDAPAIASASTEGHIPPKTAQQKLASKNELKAKSTLLLAIPDEHLLKFHGIKDANTLWEAIKARFGGNKESKKMQKTILKQQYTNFTASRSEGLDKTYDRFQKLISQLEIHYDSTSTNEAVNTVHDILVVRSKGQASSSTYADDVMFSFFVNQSNSPYRGHFARECRAPRNQGNKNGDAPRRIIPVETPANVLVVQDGICSYDWSYQAKEGPTNFSLMAHLSSGSSNSSSSNTEVRDNSITELKNQLAEALREKDDLKLKLEKFETSSMKLTILISSQISVNNKSSVGFSSQMNENELHDCHLNKSEVKDNLEQPKDVRPSAPIIEEWESDSDDDCVSRPSIEQNKPSYAKINFVKSNENTKKSVIEQNTYRQAENLRKSQILTKSSNVPVNTAKQSSSRAAISNSTARYVNTAATRPTVNDAKPSSNIFHKSHSSVKRTIYQRTAPKNNDFKEKVNTTKVNNVTTAGTKAVVSVVQGHKENVVKSSACWIWRPTGKVIDHVSKDSGSYTSKRFDYGNPQYALQDQGIFDSECSRHMTGNKPYLTDYQDIDGGFVAFAGSPKGVTAGNQTNDNAGPKSSDDEFIDDAGKKNDAQYPAKDGDKNDHEKDVRDQEEALRKKFEQETKRLVDQGEATITNSTNRLNTASPSVSAAGQSFENNDLSTDPLMPDLEDSTGIFRGAYDDEDVGAEADLNNLH
ncbi:hypothetical protein Tco_0820297 [Tanacetum coccineum]|uniref:Uncharacterized protein n=1 Tax=Tanacetum coccineum TaxID=301880 RepID=A0ABQ5AD17_9ASTR